MKLKLCVVALVQLVLKDLWTQDSIFVDNRNVLSESTLLGEIVFTRISNTKYDAFGIISYYPSGKYAIVYREGNTHVAVGDYGRIKMNISSDNGKTWSDASTLVMEKGIDLRNVGGGVTPTGRIVIFYGRFNPDVLPFRYEYLGVRYIYSDNEGVTWTEPYAILAPPDTMGSYGGLISIGERKLLSSFYGTNGRNTSSYISTSSDDGATWSTPIVTLASKSPYINYTEGSYVYLGDSIILGLIRDDIGATFNQVLSTDNGITWIDQGITTFDTLIMATPAWLSVYKSLSGKLMVACYYYNREKNMLRVITGQRDGLIMNGIKAWQNAARKNITTNMGWANGGYPSVTHPNNSSNGFGWYYHGTSASIFEPTEIIFFKSHEK